MLSKARVAVVEPNKPKSLESHMQNPNHDLRVYAMTPASVSLYKELNIWDSIVSRTKPYDNMQVTLQRNALVFYCIHKRVALCTV